MISQNIDFDDDEDDYNMEDDNAGMPLFSNLNSVSPTSVDGTQTFFFFLGQMLKLCNLADEAIY